MKIVFEIVKRGDKFIIHKWINYEDELILEPLDLEYDNLREATLIQHLFNGKVNGEL